MKQAWKVSAVFLYILFMNVMRLSNLQINCLELGRIIKEMLVSSSLKRWLLQINEDVTIKMFKGARLISDIIINWDAEDH